MHADLVDQAERECLLHDGRTVQAHDLVTRDVLGMLNRAGDAAGDECVQGWVGHGRLLWVTTRHGQVVSGAIRSGPAPYRRRRLVRISEVSEPAARAKHADQVGVRLQVGDARISTAP